ncbi:hypothetical protein T439DRAFT_384494 [Meredithblackwellia eburnea MCA 4105]
MSNNSHLFKYGWGELPNYFKKNMGNMRELLLLSPAFSCLYILPTLGDELITCELGVGVKGDEIPVHVLERILEHMDDDQINELWLSHLGTGWERSLSDIIANKFWLTFTDPSSIKFGTTEYFRKSLTNVFSNTEKLSEILLSSKANEKFPNLQRLVFKFDIGHLEHLHVSNFPHLKDLVFKEISTQGERLKTVVWELEALDRFVVDVKSSYYGGCHKNDRHLSIESISLTLLDRYHSGILANPGPNGEERTLAEVWNTFCAVFHKAATTSVSLTLGYANLDCENFKPKIPALMIKRLDLEFSFHFNQSALVKTVLHSASASLEHLSIGLQSDSPSIEDDSSSNEDESSSSSNEDEENQIYPIVPFDSRLLFRRLKVLEIIEPTLGLFSKKMDRNQLLFGPWFSLLVERSPRLDTFVIPLHCGRWKLLESPLLYHKNSTRLRIIFYNDCQQLKVGDKMVEINEQLRELGKVFRNAFFSMPDYNSNSGIALMPLKAASCGLVLPDGFQVNSQYQSGPVLNEQTRHEFGGEHKRRMVNWSLDSLKLPEERSRRETPMEKAAEDIKHNEKARKKAIKGKERETNKNTSGASLTNSPSFGGAPSTSNAPKSKSRAGSMAPADGNDGPGGDDIKDKDESVDPHNPQKPTKNDSRPKKRGSSQRPPASGSAGGKNDSGPAQHPQQPKKRKLDVEELFAGLRGLEPAFDAKSREADHLTNLLKEARSELKAVREQKDVLKGSFSEKVGNALRRAESSYKEMTALRNEVRSTLTTFIDKQSGAESSLEIMRADVAKFIESINKNLLAADGKLSLEKNEKARIAVLKEMEMELSKTHGVLDQLREQLATKSGEISEARDRIASLETARDGQFQNVSQDLKQAREEFSDLTKKNRVLAEKAREWQETSLKIGAELQGVQAAKVEAERLLSAEQERRSEAVLRLKEVESKMSKGKMLSNALHAETRKEVEVLSARLQECFSQYQTTLALGDELRAKLELERDKLQAERDGAEANRHDADVSDLKEEILVLKSEIQKISADRDKESSKASQAEQVSGLVRKAMEDVNMNLARKEATLSQLEGEILTLKKTIADPTELKKLENSLMVEQEARQSITQESTKLKSDNQALKAANESLAANVSDLAAELSEAKDAIAKYQTDGKSVEARIDEARRGAAKTAQMALEKDHAIAISEARNELKRTKKLLDDREKMHQKTLGELAKAKGRPTIAQSPSTSGTGSSHTHINSVDGDGIRDSSEDLIATSSPTGPPQGVAARTTLTSIGEATAEEDVEITVAEGVVPLNDVGNGGDGEENELGAQKKTLGRPPTPKAGVSVKKRSVVAKSGAAPTSKRGAAKGGGPGTGTKSQSSTSLDDLEAEAGDREGEGAMIDEIEEDEIPPAPVEEKRGKVKGRTPANKATTTTYQRKKR